MKNNEIKKIYNKILDIIKNTNDYCEFYIRDKKFIFRDRTTPNIISIILTDKELLDLDSGIYSERTRLLKELEYMNRIKENEEIEPFKNMKERDNYKKFWDKYKEISKLKDTDFVEYIKQKEVLFIKNDMKKIEDSKIDYSKIITYYKRKLVDYGAIRELKNVYKSVGKYTGTINKENRVVA